MKRSRNLRITELLRSRNSPSGVDLAANGAQAPEESLSQRKPRKGAGNRVARRTRKIKKMSFFTSRTGKNLNKLNKSSVLKKRRIVFLEDEAGIFEDRKGLLLKTIPQKNDNDIDSEPEIISLGVRFLHRKLLQSIARECDLLRPKKNSRRKKRARKVEPGKRNSKIQDYFCPSRNFNTPSERRVSGNDFAYINSIMSSTRQNKVNFGPALPFATVFSKNSLARNSKGRGWGDGKTKTSLLTFNTDLSGTAGKVWSRKDSSLAKQLEAHKASLGSMFLESPHFRKA